MKLKNIYRKENFNLNHEQLMYYNNEIKKAYIKLKKTEKEFEKSKKKFDDKRKLVEAKKELKKHKNIKKLRVYNQRLWYDYPVTYEEYKNMIKDLEKTVLWLRDRSKFFKGKKRYVWDQHIGSWDVQLSLTNRNMRKLNNNVKKSWRRARWRYLANETTEDISGSPYIYEIKGKKYLSFNLSSLKKFIKLL